jgi:6-phosphogluconolactonase
MIAPHPVDGQIYVADLGIDQVVVYDLDAESGTLSAALVEGSVTLVPGTGPRHFAFAGGGDRLYVVGELACTVTYFDRDEHSSWTERQTISTLPEDYVGEATCAQILLSPDGGFLYASNRGHDSIAVFAVDESGRLEPLGHPETGGQTPRNFAISPDGDWLFAANQNSDNVVVFRRDQESGALSQHGEPVRVPAPMCVIFA